MDRLDNDVGQRMFLSDLARSSRILVVGDLMLDRYWFGEVNRISPEAPVPVVSATDTDVRAGGAANVAMNLAALQTQASLLSVIGDDEAGRSAADILGNGGVNRHLHVDQEMKTTEKLRIISRQQQLLRVDFEQNPSAAILQRCALDYQELINDIDVVVLSDYGKGGLAQVQTMIEMARQRAIPVVVDPKGDNYRCYRGATVVTPNLKEFLSVVGPWDSEEELTTKAQLLMEEYELEHLLVTRGADGMTLLTGADAPLSVQARSQEVYDVTGAGDTVVAVVAIGIACAAQWSEILMLANAATGVVVGKLGTAVTTPQEINAFINVA